MEKSRAESKIKAEKKNEYGFFSNTIFNMRSAKKWDQKLFWFQLLAVPPTVASGWLGVLLPAELVRALESKWSMGQLTAYIFLLAFCMWILEMLTAGMREYLYRNGLTLHLYYQKCCFSKVMKFDYDMLENPDYRRTMGNTWNVIRSGYGLREAVLAVPESLCGMLGTVFYGMMIGRKSILLVVLLIVNMSFGFLTLSVIRKKNEQHHKKLGDDTSKAAYISRQSMEKSAGKEIRIYQMADWFLEKYDECLKGIDGIQGRIHNNNFHKSLADALVSCFLEGFAYLHLIYLLMKGKMRVSDFVLYVGLLEGFGRYFETLIHQVLSLNSMSISISYIREFLNLSESRGKTGGVGREKLERLKESGVKVELKHVSYTYPGQSEPVLSDINLVIHPGEKLALIGLNGAGKTTLVKLLCGFYRPSSGEILINDIPAEEFGREEYYSLVSVLFQDFVMLPLSLDENLTARLPEEIDRQHLTWALEVSGFLEKYESLTEKGKTLLVREANEEAVDFSGGERQKLLFARALCKKAPLLILDEPTAALDPIAENELYRKYSEACSGRTSVYISHRLSSTRFCDRIILLSKGRIVEEGTHDELMAKKGRYAELFAVQSRYYKEQEERRRLSEIMEDAFEQQEETEGVFYEQAGF